MVNFLLGKQFGFTKYPCFLCMWDSRDRALHYTKKDWPMQEELVPCKERNVINDPLVDRDRIIFPPLHIKLNQAVHQGSGQGCDCFTYFCQAFPGLTMEKLKAGIFDSPQILQLIRHPEFENSMNEVKLEEWKALVQVVKTFLGNNKARNYAELVNNMLTAFRNLGCNISVKCTTYFYIWTGFLRTWVQWVTSRGRDSIRTWKRWRPGIRVAGTQSWWMTTVGIWRETSLPLSIPGVWKKKGKFKPWSLNNVEATSNLCVLTFINAHHSVYSNQCFYQVFNICCWQYIFSLKNIFRMICVDKNKLIMPQKCNRFCQKIWFFSNQPRKKNLTWWRETDAISWFSSANIPKSVVEI